MRGAAAGAKPLGGANAGKAGHPYRGTHGAYAYEADKGARRLRAGARMARKKRAVFRDLSQQRLPDGRPVCAGLYKNRAMAY